MMRAQLSDGFDSAHALIVRPLGDGWQIVSGHQRVEVPRRAVLDEVLCWVRGFDDEAATCRPTRRSAWTAPSARRC
jgi:hypothetical protein